MIPKILTITQIEEVYDRIAAGIDQAGEAKRVLFLAKLSLALANFVGDEAKIGMAIEAASRDL